MLEGYCSDAPLPHTLGLVFESPSQLYVCRVCMSSLCYHAVSSGVPPSPHPKNTLRCQLPVGINGCFWDRDPHDPVTLQWTSGYIKLMDVCYNIKWGAVLSQTSFMWQTMTQNVLYSTIYRFSSLEDWFSANAIKSKSRVHNSNDSSLFLAEICPGERSVQNKMCSVFWGRWCL